jgi:hypothetical protein
MKNDHIADGAAIRICRGARVANWVVLFLLLAAGNADVVQAAFDDPNIETRIEQYVQPPKNYLEERPAKKVRRCPTDGQPADKNRLKKKQDDCRN